MSPRERADAVDLENHFTVESLEPRILLSAAPIDFPLVENEDIFVGEDALPVDEVSEQSFAPDLGEDTTLEEEENFLFGEGFEGVDLEDNSNSYDQDTEPLHEDESVFFDPTNNAPATSLSDNYFPIYGDSGAVVFSPVDETQSPVVPAYILSISEQLVKTLKASNAPPQGEATDSTLKPRELPGLLSPNPQETSLSSALPSFYAFYSSAPFSDSGYFVAFFRHGLSDQHGANSDPVVPSDEPVELFIYAYSDSSILYSSALGNIFSSLPNHSHIEPIQFDQFWEQVGQAISGSKGIENLHIFGKFQDQQFNVGNETLSLQEWMEQFRQQAGFFADHAKVYFYTSVAGYSGYSLILSESIFSPDNEGEAEEVFSGLSERSSEGFLVPTLALEKIDSRIVHDNRARRSGNLSDSHLVESPEQIVIIDSAVEDYQSIIDSLQNDHANLGTVLVAGEVSGSTSLSDGMSGGVDLVSDHSGNAPVSASTQPSLVVHILETEKSGIDQISEILDQYRGLLAVHMISHGSSGSVRLGNTLVDKRRLDLERQKIMAWGKSLKPGGDILLYGCEVADGEVGIGFVESLAALTGADVAASTDATGSSELGGDWVLELSSGVIESTPIFTATSYDWLLLQANTETGIATGYVQRL